MKVQGHIHKFEKKRAKNGIRALCFTFLQVALTLLLSDFMFLQVAVMF